MVRHYLCGSQHYLRHSHLLAQHTLHTPAAFSRIGLQNPGYCAVFAVCALDITVIQNNASTLVSFKFNSIRAHINHIQSALPQFAQGLSVCAPLSLTPSPWLLCVHRHTVSVQRWLTIRTYTGSILYPVICDATRTAQRIEHQQQNMCKTIKYHGRNELCVCVRTLRHGSSSNVRCLLRSHFVFLTYPSMYQRHDIHLPHTHTY